MAYKGRGRQLVRRARSRARTGRLSPSLLAKLRRAVEAYKYRPGGRVSRKAKRSFKRTAFRQRKFRRSRY